ncbi:MAG: hypothetical protein ACREDF_05465, partial [Thermoplasmata archaeon]
AETMQRPLSPEERLRKARDLLRQGTEEFEAAEGADAELSIRRRAAIACETAFHSLVELADARILEAKRALPASHDDRVEALKDLGRTDLAHLYSRAFQALHISGYYGQRVGKLQRESMREVAQTVERELERLA